MSWQMIHYSTSGTTLVTDGTVALYLYNFDKQMGEKIDETEWEILKFNYAKWLEEVLNKTTLPGTIDSNQKV